MTPQESHLWYDFLRHYPVKIYKQRIIGNYIVDFYCASAKLVIEVDGAQHYEEYGREYDAARTVELNAVGLQVLRFSNRDIEKRFKEVCCEIDKKIQALSVPHDVRDTSPKGRGMKGSPSGGAGIVVSLCETTDD